MENKDNYFSELKDELIDYGKTRFDLAKITTYEKTARVAAFVFSFLLLCFFLFLTLIFLSFTAAYYLGFITGNPVLGFGIVTAIDFLLLLFVWFFRKNLIEKPVINSVIKIFFDTENHEQDTKS